MTNYHINQETGVDIGQTTLTLTRVGPGPTLQLTTEEDNQTTTHELNLSDTITINNTDYTAEFLLAPAKLPNGKEGDRHSFSLFLTTKDND